MVVPPQSILAHAEVWEQACLWKPKPENAEYLGFFYHLMPVYFPHLRTDLHFSLKKFKQKSCIGMFWIYLQHCCVSLLKQRQQKKLYVLLPCCLRSAESTSGLRNKPHFEIINNFISEMFSPGAVATVTSWWEELHRWMYLYEVLQIMVH